LFSLKLGLLICSLAKYLDAENLANHSHSPNFPNLNGTKVSLYTLILLGYVLLDPASSYSQAYLDYYNTVGSYSARNISLNFTLIAGREILPYQV